MSLYYEIYYGENKCSEKTIISDLYYTYTSAMKAHIIVNLKFTYYISSAIEAHIIVARPVGLSRVYYDVETS